MDSQQVIGARVPSGIEWDQEPGGNCPVQGEGVWNGRKLYFRARGDAWRLSVGDEESGAVMRAHGPLGNSGWMGRTEADELARVHLWAWSWCERDMESIGPQGKLCTALRLLDPQAVALALSNGASPNVTLEEDGPLPLAMALAFSGDEGVGSAGEPDEANEASSRKSFFAVEALAVWDEARSERRARCVDLLLKAGADPNARGRAWVLSPSHWAALLPSGQMMAIGGEMWAKADGGAASLSDLRLKESARARANPWFALDAAGARRDGGGGLEADPLELAMSCCAMELAEAMAEAMEPEAMRRVATRWVESAGTDVMVSRIGSQEGVNPYAQEAFSRVLLAVESGRWPIEWLIGEWSRPEAAEAAGEAHSRLLSIFEAKALEKASRRPKKVHRSEGYDRSAWLWEVRAGLLYFPVV